MSDAEKQKQLLELLAKSCKFIVANLTAIEKEMYIFAIKGQKEKVVHASQTLTAVSLLLKDYPEPKDAYVPRKYPDSFKQKVTDEKMLKLIATTDAVLALVRGKIVPIIKLVQAGKVSARVSSDVIKINHVLKTYIASLTVNKEAST
mmetsp:Transcript_31276/g.76596  ORF Transcript_31276/g.76596 Transcript_31276/m.76596 type:complete len:147 (+) Transcript_31276:383-823(+)